MDEVLEDNASIRLEKAWRKCGGARVAFRCLGQFGDRTGLETDVWIQEKDEIARSRLSADVASASIAEILWKAKDADGISLSDADRIVAARVIHNDNFSGIGQPAETFAQDVAAVVAHDDNADSRISWRHLHTASRKSSFAFRQALPNSKDLFIGPAR